MAMSRTSTEPVAVAILAKAPVPGFAKTRLAAVLGPDGAARLQARLIERAVRTAAAAAIGPMTLWTAGEEHPFFRRMHLRLGITVASQPDGDLGARMLAALSAAGGPALVIGTDCPALTPDHLRMAAEDLRGGIDVVILPVDDGGYALIGMRRPQPALFSAMSWSSETVMPETRRRLRQCGLAWRELAQLWDVDVPEDLERLRRAGLAKLIG
jgi:rSAM/selenodomain-associated transferase 1